MVKKLVEVYQGEIVASSRLVAKHFGVQHNHFTTTVEKVIAKLKDQAERRPDSKSAPNYYTEERTYRGSTFTVYLMSRKFFSLVSMRFTTDAAFDWQTEFNEAFYLQEEKLLSDNQIDAKGWLEQRHIGKKARREQTDAIKVFVDYAQNQGDTSKPSKYYAGLTVGAYKALDVMRNYKKDLRETMGIYELSELMLAERYAAHKLQEYMDLGRHYNDIYASVCKDLIVYAHSIRIPTTTRAIEATA